MLRYVASGTAVFLFLVTSPFVAAQSFSPPGIVPSAQLPNWPNQYTLTSQWFSDITIGDLKFGLFYGGGGVTVMHSIGAGPEHRFVDAWGPNYAAPGTPDFDTFVHYRKTDLRDVYCSFQVGLRRRDSELLALNVETNFGRVTDFKQYTEAGQGTFRINNPRQGRLAALTLNLLNGQNGIITLDNRNRMWTADLRGEVPFAPGWAVLWGYKWTTVRTAIDPYSSDRAAFYSIPPPPPLWYTQLPGLSGWHAVWASLEDPSTTSFQLNQFFRWHGPFVGLRVKDLLSLSTWNLDFIIAPWLFGKYEFQWETAFRAAPPGEYLGASQVTEANGYYRFLVEVRTEGKFDLTGGTTLEIFGKCSYVYLNGSVPKTQTLASGSAFPPTFNYSQEAPQQITMRQYFWGIGSNLVFPF